MRLVAVAATDVGRVRSENQDAVYADDRVAVVADGMGGHRGGEVASTIAVAEFDGTTGPLGIDDLAELARRANREIFERSINEPLLAGMGTTLCAVAALGGADSGLGIINVGDSRAYLLDREGLRQISEDHSFVETLVREGRLTPEQAEVHPQRNVLTRALGIEPLVPIDAWIVECADGDRFLLCSDGLFNEVSDTEIEAVLRAEVDPQRAAQALIESALEAGAHDNVSCVVIDVVDSVAAIDPDRRVVRRVLGGEDAERPVGELAQAEQSTPDETLDAHADAAVRSRFTWRVALVLLSILAVLAVAAGAIGWYGRSTYWVGVRGDDVVQFRGHPDGVLWIEPKVTRTDLRLDQISSSKDRVDLCNGKQFADAEEVATLLARLAREAVASQPGVTCTTVGQPAPVSTTTSDGGPTVTTTTTTSTTSTTTTTPP